MSERSWFGGGLPSRRATLRGPGLALAAAAIFWFFGADVWHAILLGCASGVIGSAVTVVGTSELRDLSWRAEDRTRPTGARNDVARLSWSLRSGRGRVGRTAEIRLRALARRRLAIEGLDLANPVHRPMIERRIGAPVYRILVREQLQGLRLGTMTACLDALDALDPTVYPAPPRARRTLRWAPSLIPSRHRGKP